MMIDARERFEEKRELDTMDWFEATVLPWLASLDWPRYEDVHMPYYPRHMRCE